jgi:5'-deoxynucleotidase
MFVQGGVRVQSVFLALLYRLRTTARWSGMMTVQPEDVASHTFGVVMIAHILCTIDREIFGGHPNFEQILGAALLHDGAESILTDVVAPVKKYNSEIEAAFVQLEGIAERQLLDTLPKEIQPAYENLFNRNDPEIADYIHAADKLDALCKCRMEVRRGNQDFVPAKNQIENALLSFADRMPSVRYFMDTFMPAFDHSVDEYRYMK